MLPCLVGSVFGVWSVPCPVWCRPEWFGVRPDGVWSGAVSALQAQWCAVEAGPGPAPRVVGEVCGTREVRRDVRCFCTLFRLLLSVSGGAREHEMSWRSGLYREGGGARAEGSGLWARPAVWVRCMQCTCIRRIRIRTCTCMHTAVWRVGVMRMSQRRACVGCVVAASTELQQTVSAHSLAAAHRHNILHSPDVEPSNEPAGTRAAINAGRSGSRWMPTCSL
jgi:hypothetical protein